MSMRYKGALLSATPPTTSTAQSVPGLWTLQQQLQGISGSGWPAPYTPIYIEDMFSTYLYTGNGSTQTITNGIDLSGKGGLVWIKGRSGATGHRLTDTARGATKSLESNSTAAEATESTGLTAFNGTGFSIGADADYNTNTATYVSWTFRKQAKFFDVVTYTGNGANRTIAHNLGSVPGCIIVKNITNLSNFVVYHRSTGATQRGVLNSTVAFGASSVMWNNTEPTSTVFTVGTGDTNTSGDQFVAYLFAHDAGGFGLTGTDNVISCGSFTTDGSGNATVNLGYEPQWILYKDSQSATNWITFDVMRGWALTGGSAQLFPNTSGAENNAGGTNQGYPTATGFVVTGQNPSKTLIYIAIRRGPMKVPTSGTSVFTAANGTNNGVGSLAYTAGFPVDSAFRQRKTGLFNGNIDRLRGEFYLETPSTAAETASDALKFQSMTGLINNSGGNFSSDINWMFRRAPGFFDVVAYTGNSTIDRVLNHNLGVAPELVIFKARSSTSSWWTCTQFDSTGYTRVAVDLTNAGSVLPYSGNTEINAIPTSTTLTLSNSGRVNGTPTYVAYLFASVAGVSKVGSYTGTGTTKQIDCGFTGGARFVLIKRTDSTGDWYVWDSARGIVAGNDPYLLLNSTAAEVTNTDYVDTYSAGFEISSTAPAAINANGGTFIFLAIA